MSLHLVSLRPDLPRLTAFAAKTGALPAGGDLGYAVHLALRQALGATAPQPWRFFEQQRRLLGYCRDLGGFEAAVALPPLDERTESARAALALDGVETRTMPTTWRSGLILDFEVRLRPVRRTGLANRSKERPGEHDAFGVAVRGLPREEWPSRDEVYLGFAREKLEASGAIALSRLSLAASTRTEVARSRHDGGAPRKRIDGPDVTVMGRFSVQDPEGFAELLTRGVGRHRAFGFGMLLLKPPGR
ncbi:CRISPR system Cascade subunit CasE [Methylobacterium sp. 174MFSha1.1]|uniref:type I-E CRISPR-associated protein Cas6/Cse3/CasE n=1 Tax=Methylobacterium sp. 174MFSha1.1 TaxID=1502749 RepID=UPI0008E5B298|nr:type I-E CRISPR-associated protein Cas6/Cse3/CasE [Methylobacterium sp. 174MFSha1.1]SFU70676.1 CRISPR system Cascade subunit CasE [Methylobacterium sp. 174MFSha1.1]